MKLTEKYLPYFMDELRYRKENKETREKVFELDMRVDNLEKAIMPA